MKTAHCKLIALLIFFAGSLGAAELAIEEARTQLTAVENALPVRSRDPGAIVERTLDSLIKVPGFSELRGEIKKNWSSHLGRVNEIAATPAAQAIYFRAAQVLDAAAYQHLILASADQVVAGNIPSMQFRWIVFPHEKHLREMWNEDPPSAELKKVATRVCEVMGNDPSMVRFMTNVVGGEVAAANRDFNPEANPLPKTTPTQPPQSINTVSIPAPDPVSPPPTPAAAPPVKSSNVVWWVVGLIILAAGVVFVARKKKPKA